MPFTKIKCQHCGKVAEAEREFKIGDKLVLRLKCGHLIDQSVMQSSRPEDIISLDGKKLFNFQLDGVRFIEES